MNDHDGRFRLIAIAAGFVLVVAACGGRDGAGTTAAPSPTSAPTTAAPPAKTTTAAPITTTMPATTTTVATGSPLIAVARGFAGEWTGTWTNTTFGSTGPTEASVEVMDDGSIIVTIDLGGFVFGQGDPEPERWIVNLVDLAQPVTVQSTTFGEVTLILSVEGARIIAVDVPADGIANFQLDARFEVGPRIVGTYLVGFDDGTAAEGTTELAQTVP